MSIVDKYENMLLLLGVKRLSSPAQILKIIAEIKELSNFFGRVKTDDLNTIEASTPDELLEIKGGTDLSTRITDGKIYFDLSTAILGQLEYRGSWDASSGVYPSTPAPEKGWYFVISIAGTISGIEYEISDWIIYNGTSWDRLSGNLLENETSPKLGVNLNANSKKITNLANGVAGTDGMALGQRYTNAEAVSSMGVKADGNPLHHDKYALESHNKDKHTDIDQSLKTTDDVSFNKVSLTAGNVVVGTIQLTDDEWKQLANIGVITISAVQWGYLGALDQALSQASSPTFGGLTLIGVLAMGANKITGLANGVAGTDGMAFGQKYTDANARASINDIFGSDGKADKTIDLDGNDIDNIKDIDGNIFFCSTEAEINSAISTIGANGGTIILASGTINLTAPITINIVGSIIIMGMGDKTIIDCNGDRSAFILTAGNRIVLRDFKIDARDMNVATTIAVQVNCNNVIMDNITILGTDPNLNGKGIMLDSVSYCKIINCTLDTLRWGIYLSSSTRNIISKNHVLESSLYHIYLTASNYNIISDNNCYSSSVSPSIYLTGSEHNTIEGNILEDGGAGIDLMSSSNNNIVGYNRCHVQAHGIRISASNNNTITGNNCSYINRSTPDDFGGIYITADANYNTINGNTCNYNTNAGSGTHYGIWIANANCDDNTVMSNTALQNDVNYLDNGTNTFDSTTTDGDPLNNFVVGAG